jgi:hypothetical protein
MTQEKMKRVPPCRGCTGYPWLGLIDVRHNQLLHERTTAPGELEVIVCTNPKKIRGRHPRA